MAFDKGPCGPQFEDWEQAHQDWQNKDAAADAAIERAAVATAVALGLCGLAWTGAALAPCIAATALALELDRQSISASQARNAAAAKSNAAQTAYENCVEAHKGYYNPGG